IKLCLGVKTSSAMRTVSPWATYRGPGMVDLLEKLVANYTSTLVLLHETSSAVVANADFDDAKHLSCIIREEAAQKTTANEQVIVCAALVERDCNGVSFVQAAFGLDTAAKRLEFFERYARLYLEAFLTPAHKYGFAFEAHGQNTLARFDCATGQLVGFAVRDFSSTVAHAETLWETLGVKQDILPGASGNADTLHEVYDLIYHTTIQCHMHALIRALDLHYSGIGWRVVRRELRRAVPVDSGLYRFFTRPRVELKCFIAMKMQGLYRDVSSRARALCIKS
ncbi:hypothetical protein THASP1DRAFT_19309, partial [Thamnocephalis sphaerospora]